MPTNTLSVYDPLFYAQEALIQLEKALGMAARVHRGYDKEPQSKGSIIKIRKGVNGSGGAAPGGAVGQSSAGVGTISRADANDAGKYRAAKENAAKAGVDLTIVG